MSSPKLPAFQFYPGDWRKDPGIQGLDYETRGIWLEILLLMHESEYRGKLLLNGQPMPVEALARNLGLEVREVEQAVSKLEAYGVSSIDPETGALINRRMVREEAMRQAKVEAGRKGGQKSRPPNNPTEPKQDGSTPPSRTEANGGSSVSSSSSVSKKQHGLSPREVDKSPGFTELMEAVERECHLGLEMPDIANSRSILKMWLKQGRTPQDIMAAILGSRIMVDAGQVDWIKPRTPFSLKALNHQQTVTEDGVRDFFVIARDAYRGSDDSVSDPRVVQLVSDTVRQVS